MEDLQRHSVHTMMLSMLLFKLGLVHVSEDNQSNHVLAARLQINRSFLTIYGSLVLNDRICVNGRNGSISQNIAIVDSGSCTCIR